MHIDSSGLQKLGDSLARDDNKLINNYHPLLSRSGSGVWLYNVYFWDAQGRTLSTFFWIILYL